MATITPTASTVSRANYKHMNRRSQVVIMTWETLTEADTAAAVCPTGADSLFFQATGTFGGATLVLQGSNDGTNWVTLTDETDTAISLNAAGGVSVLERPAYIRPSASSGSSQDIDCTLAASVRG